MSMFGADVPVGGSSAFAQGSQGSGSDVKRASPAHRSERVNSGVMASVDPTRPAQKAETLTAIKPTPASSSAVKVDMQIAAKAEVDFDNLPITGPDKLAKALAFQSEKRADAEKVEAAAERHRESMKPAPQAEPEVVEKPEQREAPATEVRVEAEVKAPENEPEVAPVTVEEPVAVVASDNEPPQVADEDKAA